MIHARSRLIKSIVILLWCALVVGRSFAAVIRVSSGGDDANSGASWALAKKTVQAAIDAAAEGDEIWVAAGTYLEHIQNKVLDPSIDPVAVNVALYGGFAGTETERAQRNWNVNLTVLDGGNEDVPSPPAVGSVVRISGGAGRATRIDGFVITGGNAIAGGGILIEGSAPTVVNNNIWGNAASIGGGLGISNYDIVPPTVAHPVIMDNRVFGNQAVEGGGGIAVIGSETLAQAGYDPAAPVIARNVFSQNTSMKNGGGVGCWGHTAAEISNNIIVANTAAGDESTFAGGGGGIFATSRDLDDQPLSYAICAPRIVSNAIVANGGYLGAGIHCWDTEDEHGGIPVITNNTIASNNGIGVYWRVSSPVMTNNLVAFNPWGLQQPEGATNSPTISHNNVFGNSVRGRRTDYNGIADQAGIDGNISADPLFANARIGDIRIQPGSPCRDAGTNSAVDEAWMDIEGEDRIVNGTVDIGADESDGTSWDVPTPVIRVRPDGNDAEDGSTWAKAKRTVGAGVTAAFLGGGGEVWVAEGTYVERIAVNAFTYLYGGFEGTETGRDQRDFTAHPTILDGGGVPNVVTFGRAGYLTSAIDGFTVRNGGSFTDGAYPFTQPRYAGRGGGINCRQGSPLIENNIITRNSVGNPDNNADFPGYGGGLYIYMYFGLIRGNTFTENEVLNTFDGSGGGLYCYYSMPTIQGNTFTGNRALSGSAVFATLSQPDIVGNAVVANSMYVLTPLYNGSTFGAVQLYMNEDFLVQGNTIKSNVASAGAGLTASTNWGGKILDNLVTGNVAENAYHYGGMGGGMYLLVQDSATENLVVANNTVVANSATTSFLPPPANEQGGGIALSLVPAIPPPPEPPPAKLVLANNIVAFNSSGVWQNPTTPMPVPTLAANDVYGSTSGASLNYINISPGATDISLDPLFVAPGTEDYRLQEASPCLDAGDNALVPAGLTADFDGNPRLIDGDGDSSAVVDMGVYEYTSGTDTAAPTVAITAPTANATYVTSGPVIDLAGSAADDVGITGVTWTNDRGTSGTCEGTSSWTAQGVLLFLGPNVITVRAVDKVTGGNAGTDVITVTYTLPLTVSGYVRTAAGSGVGGVIMSGLPSTPSTDPSGFYLDAAVPYGWSGEVEPLKTGLTFSPTSIVYTAITVDQANQDYVASGGLILPTVTTAAATSVTSTTASCGGTVVSDGGAAVTARGICWALVPEPTLAGSFTLDGTGTGSFVSSVSGLMPGFTYYVRAYATSVAGTAYGENVSFTAQARDYALPFSESFSSSARPVDWSVQVEGSEVTDPWSVNLSNVAGGQPNEMRARFQYAFGTVRLVTPPIDTTGRDILTLSFRYKLNSWDVGGVVLSVETSPDGVTWSDEGWSLSTDASDIGPVSIGTTLENNLGIKTTYVAFVIKGDLFYFEDWFVDDVSVAGTPSAKVDFNGDGQEDILWRYQAEGAYQGMILAWLMSWTDTGIASPSMSAPAAGAESVLLGSGSPASVPAPPASAMAREGAAAPALSFRSVLEGGKTSRPVADRVLKNPMELEAAPGEVELASLSLATEAMVSILPDLTWEIAGTADFNGDGETDILWRNYGTGPYQGMNDIWFMDGTAFVSESLFSVIPDTDWRIAATGDFDSDGSTDILWRYHGEGALQGMNLIWFMDGPVFRSEAIFSQIADLSWRIAGTGDFDSDGETDILWRNYGTGPYQGLNVIWYMEGTAVREEALLGQVLDTSWEIAATGDFDNDGRTDVLWRYYGTGTYQGMNDVWYLDGTAFLREEIFSIITDTGWRIVNR